MDTNSPPEPTLQHRKDLPSLSSSKYIETQKTLKTFMFWFKYDLGQKYYAPQVQPLGLNS